MNCNPSKILICSIALAIFAVGCSPNKPIYLKDGGDLTHYLEQATSVEYPDAVYPSLEEVTLGQRPITVLEPDFNTFEDISLEDAVSYALLNAKVIRGYGTPNLQGARVSPGQDNLTNSPLAAGTSFNVAIRETEPGFIGVPGQIANPSALTTNTALDGNQGVESALADFDAQLTGSLNYAKSDEPRNGASQLNALNFQQDQVTWQSQIAKKSANGTQIFFRNINQWTENNNPLQPLGVQELDSWYRASFEAEIRQPILRGRGTFINRMPIVISRIGTDQEIANLESNMQNFVTNIEIRYWDLYCAYRSFSAAKTGANAALTTYRIVKDQFDEGSEVNIQQVAQSEEQVFFFQAQVLEAKNNLLNAEGQLRFLLGWAATDGRMLRPVDDPFMSPIEFDWCNSLCEALTYRPELRQERWEVKKRELALAYSKNGLLPQLDVNLVYRWLGLGNRHATSGESNPFPNVPGGAYNELGQGDFQELSFGATFGMPVGFRRELNNVRNAQLKLARELARIEDMELDVQKELTEAFRALDLNLGLMQASFNRWKNTVEEEEHFERLEDAGAATLDVALDAQRRRSQAEVAFYTAMCEYNKVIALIHRRKGTTLAYSGVSFNEGPWTGKAYMDAQEHARRRGASRQINYGFTRPQVISRGQNWPTNQNVGRPPTANVNGTIITPDYSTAPAMDPFGGQMMDGGMQVAPGMLMEGQLMSPTPAPLYDGTIGSGEIIPTPAVPSLNGASNRVQPTYDRAVQQASYVDEVPVQVVASPRVASSSRKRVVTPVAVRRSSLEQPKQTRAVPRVVPVEPKRDINTMPAKRLKAQTPLRTQTANTQSSNGNRVLRKGTLNWEKLGLDRPEKVSGASSAKIKTLNN